MPKIFGYLSPKEYADIESVSRQWIIELILAEKIIAIEERSNTGRGGVTYRIPIEQLSPEGLHKYFDQHFIDPNESQIIFKFNSPLLTPGNKNRLEKAMYRLRIVEKAQHAPSGYKKLDWYKKIADREGISPRSLQRWVECYQNYGCIDVLDRQSRNDKGSHRAFCKQAADTLLAYYFGQKHITVLQAYKKTVQACLIKNWIYGSINTASRIIKDIGECKALEMYRDEGVWGLKNNIVRPILRSYKDLQVNEIWCGDQHVFNWFVYDENSGVFFRPTGFMWIDIRSRRVMGNALGRTYNKNTVALALLDGILPNEGSSIFGIPQIVYTDWGKPEMSNLLHGMRLLGSRPTIENKQMLKLLRKLYPDTKGVYEHLGISPQQAIVRNPQAKPIEPFFGHFEQRLLEKGIPGWAGNKVGTLTDKDIQDLKQERINGNILSFTSFFKLVQQTIAEYNESMHRGKDMAKFSPNEMWDIALRKGYRPMTIDRRSAEMIILPKEKRIVQRDGIHYDNKIFSDRSLSDIIGKEVYIAVDPYTEHKAIVFYKGQWYCDAKEYKYVKFNASKEELAAAMAEQNAQKKEYVTKYKQIVNKKCDVQLPEEQKIKTLIDQGVKSRTRKEQAELETIFRDDIKEEDVWKILENQMAN